MRLIHFPFSSENTAVQQLPEPDLVVDPRPIVWEGNDWDEHYYKFKLTVNGTTLTITRTDPRNNHQAGWRYEIRFRVYNSNEDRYSFNSTLYLYHGLEGERAPLDTTEVIFKDGVETIRDDAFKNCNSLVKVPIPDSVKDIEYQAFCYCESLRFVQLPPNLEFIGYQAFSYSSLEAVFLPPTVTFISSGAFEECISLRILNIPDNGVIDIDRSVSSNYGESSGGFIIDGCESLLTDEMTEATDEEQIKWLRNRYNPFHNLCCQPSPSPQAILQYIQGHSDNELRARTNDKPQFTALHLLVANPSLTSDMITAYLQLAPDVTTMQDSIGMTPLHMLCSLPQFSESTGSAIRAYFDCSEEGKEAAFMIDSQGKTPFQYLCEKSFDDMPFLKNKGFGGLFVWWFDCLEMNLFTEGVVVENNENTKIRKWKFFWW